MLKLIYFLGVIALLMVAMIIEGKQRLKVMEKRLAEIKSEEIL